ncbi:2-dehydropantoate 2-reductase [Pyrenophora seminiperda CCB06]|uniref:2-dehydropantoate 2-reductase n=1 Tax=Pyrenophora seminiperda CCB06 TaxID=1302712 RepID=A0A3M7M679_9PLEO|nr:2-dehydropantoate 2-reductase [Pyrenophora seminiperda CCB06]
MSPTPSTSGCVKRPAASDPEKSVRAEKRRRATEEACRKKAARKEEAEKDRKAVEDRLAHTVALRRKKDNKRRAELRKNPATNYLHILEVYRLWPLERYSERNTYLTSLLANKCMPADDKSELGLAVTYAKDHWEDYGEWPRDTARFAQYERERRAKAQKK